MTRIWLYISIIILIFVTIYLLLKKDGIPKIIYQTYHDKKLIPDKVYKNIKKYAPEYKHIIYDDQECLDFLKKNYKKPIIDRFIKLKGPHKADLFRYCILYKTGGVYLDIKTQLITPLSELFSESNAFYTVIGLKKNTIHQGVIACPKKHPIFPKLINYTITTSLEKINKAGNYHIFVKDMYRKLKETTSNNKLKKGLNQTSQGLDYILFNEKCSRNKKQCQGKLDRYGYCCYIYYKNKKVIKTRYSDYPW